MRVEDHYTVSVNLIRSPPERKGMVVGSTGVSKAVRGFHRYTLVAREVSTNEKLTFYFTPNAPYGERIDFREARFDASVFAFEIPDGRYEISNFELLAIGLYGATRTLSARNDFSIPFDIKAGQTTYLGEFIAVNVLGRNFLGMQVVAGSYWEVSDQQARDIAVARQQLSEAKFDSIISAVPDPDMLGLPFFARPGKVPSRQGEAASSP